MVLKVEDMYPYTVRRLKELDNNSKEYKLTIKRIPVELWKNFTCINGSNNIRKRVNFYYVLTHSFLMVIVIFLIFISIFVEMGPETEELLDEEIVLIVQYIAIFSCLIICFISFNKNYRYFAYQYIGQVIEYSDYKKLEYSMDELETIEKYLHKSFNKKDFITSDYLNKIIRK